MGGWAGGHGRVDWRAGGSRGRLLASLAWVSSLLARRVAGAGALGGRCVTCHGSWGGMLTQQAGL